MLIIIRFFARVEATDRDCGDNNAERHVEGHMILSKLMRPDSVRRKHWPMVLITLMK